MNAEKYAYNSEPTGLLYVFFSLGKKGIIPKVVIYEELQENLYNLAFGDYNPITQEIDDKSVSNNGDMVKILATIIQTIRDFFILYPQAILVIQGSTDTRTRLYQKIIKDNFSLIQTEFKVLALQKGGTKPETPDFLLNYEKFYISKS